MKNKFVRYEHHGKKVMVRMDLKGKHRDYCLCHLCNKFNIDNRDNNCKKANLIYSLCVLLDLVTPIWECPDFVPKLNVYNT